MKAKILSLLLLMSFMPVFPAIAAESATDARRYMVRGIAAIEMAKNNAELAQAANEFRRATELDPALSAAWYNLGSVQAKLGQFEPAIQSYKRYLALVPQAEDAQKVQDEIIKLEYRQERINKVLELTGDWIAGQTSYAISVNNLEIIVKSTEPIDARATGISVISDGGALVGKSSRTPKGNAAVLFKGRMDGASIKGIRYRSAFTEGVSSCTIPADQSEFSGSVSEDGNRITLDFQLNQFQADRDAGLFFGLDSCTGVTKTGAEPVSLVLVRKGGSRGTVDPSLKGVGLIGLSLSKSDPQLVADVLPGMPAVDAGIKTGDRILRVDGKEAKGLDVSQLLELIRGQAGSKVTVEVERQGETHPLSFTLVRKAQ